MRRVDPGLLRALTLSLILHGLIVFGLAQIETEVRSLPTQPGPLMVEVKSPRPRLPPSPSGAAREAPKAAPHRLERAPVPQLAVPAPVAARQADEPKVTPPDVSPAFAPTTGSAAPTAAEATAGYDGEDLRRFKLAIAVQARRFQRYPGLARERGWQGSTEVAIRLSADANLPQVTIEKSSGFAVLDEQAVDMIRRASAATQMPAGLQGHSIRFVLPVHFSLED